jgi:hypothetical protein
MKTLLKSLIRAPRVTGLISSIGQRNPQLQRYFSETPNQENDHEFAVSENVSEDAITNTTRVKITVPFWAASALVGTKGENIKEMKRKFGTNIITSNRYENFPGSKERVVLIEGERKKVVQTVHEVSEFFRGLQVPEWYKLSDGERHRQLKGVRMVVPTVMVSEFIGKGGENAAQIRKRFQLHKLSFHSNRRDLNESLLYISGDEKNVKETIEFLIEKLNNGPKLDKNLSYQQFYE